jgi:predicted permease
MAIAIAALIPVLNIACVIALSILARGEKPDVRGTAQTLIANPFIWSCLAGLALNPVAGFIPGPLMSAIDIIGRAALAAGLLVVGAGLDLKSLARPRLPHWLAIGLKLIVMPLVVYTFARLLGAQGPALTVAMIAASVPTASASYILARQMGGDAPLMAEIVTLQTLAAMVTMPLILLAFAM